MVWTVEGACSCSTPVGPHSSFGLIVLFYDLQSYNRSLI